MLDPIGEDIGITGCLPLRSGPTIPCLSGQTNEAAAPPLPTSPKRRMMPLFL